MTTNRRVREAVVAVRRIAVGEVTSAFRGKVNTLAPNTVCKESLSEDRRVLGRRHGNDHDFSATRARAAVASAT